MRQTEIYFSKEKLTPYPFYDTLVVLGGNIRQQPDGSYTSTDFSKGPEKSVGAHIRIAAAAILYHFGMVGHIVLSTGNTVQYDINAPSEAYVMKQELLALGIPNEVITLEESSVNTLQNAQNTALLAKEFPEKFGRRVGILTSKYHLARAMDMFLAEDWDERELSGINADRVVALSIKHHLLPSVLPHLEPLVDEIRIAYGSNSPIDMPNRLENERRGRDHFAKGTYAALPPG